jgi:hypothetical protein
MSRKKKKTPSRKQSGKKPPKRRAPVSKKYTPKRDRYGRFVSPTARKKKPASRRNVQPAKVRTPKSRRRVAPLPAPDFEVVEGEVEEDLDEDLDEDFDDDDFDEAGEEFEEEDEEEFDDVEADFVIGSDEAPTLILGEWSEDLVDLDIEAIDTMPPDDISEAVWEEILGEDFGFEDMAEMYDESDVYEFELAIAYGEAA